MPKESACHLAKQCFHDVEPRAVGGSVDVFETIWPCGQKGPGLLRDVGRMIVQDEPDAAVGRVVGVEVLQQGDKLPAAMTPLDMRRDMTGMQVEGCQDGASPQAFI